MRVRTAGPFRRGLPRLACGVLAGTLVACSSPAESPTTRSPATSSPSAEPVESRVPVQTLDFEYVESDGVRVLVTLRMSQVYAADDGRVGDAWADLVREVPSAECFELATRDAVMVGALTLKNRTPGYEPNDLRIGFSSTALKTKIYTFPEGHSDTCTADESASFVPGLGGDLRWGALPVQIVLPGVNGPNGLDWDAVNEALGHGEFGSIDFEPGTHSQFEAGRKTSISQYGGGVRLELSALLDDKVDSSEAVTAGLIGSLLREYWTAELSEVPVPRIRELDGSVESGCGVASADAGAFYCAADQAIFLAERFVQSISDATGMDPATISAYLLPRLYGEHVALNGPDGASLTEGGGRDLGAHVDCLVGIWARAAAQPNGLELTAKAYAELMVLAADLEGSAERGDGRRAADLIAAFEKGQAADEPADCA